MADHDDFNESGLRKGKGRGTERLPGTQSKDVLKGTAPVIPKGVTKDRRGNRKKEVTKSTERISKAPGAAVSLGGQDDLIKLGKDGSISRKNVDFTTTAPSELVATSSKGLGDQAGIAKAFEDGTKIIKQKGGKVTLDPNAEEVVRTGPLKKKVKSADAPDTSIDKEQELSLQFRIPKKLQNIIKNDPDQIKKLAKWVLKQIDGHQDDRQAFMQDRLPKFRKTVTDFISAGLAEVFEGQHDIHIPLAFEKCRAMHARIFQAVLGVDPMFSLKPRSAVSSYSKDAKEDLLNFILKSYINYRQGVNNVIDRDIWNFVADGTAVTRHWWKKDVRKFTSVDFDIDSDGQETETEVEREETIFDGPMMDTVPLEDFYMIGQDHGDADSYDIIAELQRYSKSDLVTNAKQGFFLSEAVDKVLERVRPDLDGTKTDDQEAHGGMKESTTGLRQSSKESGIKAFDVFEAYVKFDIDDDGIDEQLVVWIERSSKIVLRITYLERVGPQGKRPYVIKRFFEREGSAYGVGLGEMLFGLNNEMDYMHNLRLDSAVFKVLPMFKYRKTGNLGKEKPKMLMGPGKMIGLEDINDLEPLIVKSDVNFTFQEEQNINKISEGISITALSQGQISGQGATRTATGTAALVAAGDALLDISIKRYLLGFKQNLGIIDQQVVDLLPKGTMIRMTGPDGIELTKFFDNREAFRFDVDFDLDANSATSNKAVDRELSSVIFQTSLNPILIQSGVVGPQEIKNAYIDFLKSNDRKNFQRYVAGPEENLFTAKTGKDELTMIFMGIRPDVALNDKHDEKLALFAEFEASEEGLALLETEEQQQIFFETKQAHENFSKALAAQANQAAQAGFTSPQQTAAIAAGAGNPSGEVPNQIQDLAGQGLNPTQG